MHLDKDTIVDYLHTRGEHDKANRAGRELPEHVDLQAQGKLLSRLGVPGELLAKLGGMPKGPKKR